LHLSLIDAEIVGKRPFPALDVDGSPEQLEPVVVAHLLHARFVSRWGKPEIMRTLIVIKVPQMINLFCRSQLPVSSAAG